MPCGARSQSGLGSWRRFEGGQEVSAGSARIVLYEPGRMRSTLVSESKV